VGNIERKIRNLMKQEYPADKFRIIVASDASSDGTDDIVRSFETEGVQFLRFDSRMGKAAILNQVIPTLDTEIVILSDSRQTWNPEAISLLTSYFDSPSVGAVSGELVLQAEKGGFGEGVAVYWRYEKFLRKCEAALDSTCGVTGCIYAMRRSLFIPFQDDIILDDFVIPMNMIRMGKRVLFEEGAVAIDFASEDSGHEMRRKIRTLAGNYQAFLCMPWLFNPLANRLFFQFISHKVLRLIVPYLMLGVLLTNVLLLSKPLYLFLFAAQVSVFGLFLLSIFIQNRILNIVKTFMVLNWVAFYALPIYLSGRQKATWK
jgi:poly-beta-1,6-N-acetyl-D-glucosamine synthase